MFQRIGRRGWLCRCLLHACFAVFLPAPAEAFEIAGGVSAGAALVGSRPWFAVSPHASVSRRADSGFLFAVHATLDILPAIDRHGVGVVGHASTAIGYGWKSGTFSIGPALSVYSAPACGVEQCARLRGLAPGGRAQLELYFAGPLGLSASTSVDWLTGSDVLPAGLALAAAAGPIVKWGGK